VFIRSVESGVERIMVMDGGEVRERSVIYHTVIQWAMTDILGLESSPEVDECLWYSTHTCTMGILGVQTLTFNTSCKVADHRQDLHVAIECHHRTER